jgi:site-specific DNA-methyltransferase (adenine-specific)
MGATKTMLLEELEREQIERERDEDAAAEASINTPRWQTHHGDCLQVLRGMADASVDSIVTDPPYGLSFMGKRWDYDVPSEEIWRECLRVLKPGGHLLAFAGTRTQHRMAVRIEDAGFEIRDMIAWVYGSGFPKSHNLDGKWKGWGTALKPALEPVTMARRAVAGTVAANVLEHGTGGLNVDGCRIETGEIRPAFKYFETGCKSRYSGGIKGGAQVGVKTQGRWPANLIHDGSEEAVAPFPATSSGVLAPHHKRSQPKKVNTFGDWKDDVGSTFEGAPTYGDSGTAARFFYCAKANKADRDEGCERIAKKQNANWPQNLDGNDERGAAPRSNNHPTVKPTALMRYLCRLVTPPGGTVLDPFMGSGSTGKAAVLEGFHFIGIEREAEYVEIAKARIGAAESERSQMLPLEGEAA